MLPTDAVLNEQTLIAVLDSGHSRIPVHKPGNRCVRCRSKSTAFDFLIPWVVRGFSSPVRFSR